MEADLEPTVDAGMVAEGGEANILILSVSEGIDAFAAWLEDRDKEVWGELEK